MSYWGKGRIEGITKDGDWKEEVITLLIILGFCIAAAIIL
jgi:hypothetical protein